MNSLQFKGQLESGIEYSVHTVASFSGMEEIAIIIAGKPVTIIGVSPKKGGAIEIKPIMSNRVRIPGAKEVEDGGEVETNPMRPNLEE